MGYLLRMTTVIIASGLRKAVASTADWECICRPILRDPSGMYFDTWPMA